MEQENKQENRFEETMIEGRKRRFRGIPFGQDGG